MINWFIPFQAAYTTAKPAVLSQQLTQLEMDEKKVIKLNKDIHLRGKSLAMKSLLFFS